MTTPYLDERNPSFRFWALSDVMINRWDDEKQQIGTDFTMHYPLARLIVAIHRSVENGVFETDEVQVSVRNGWADVKHRVAKNASAESCFFPVAGLINLFDGELIKALVDGDAIKQIAALVLSAERPI